MNIIKKELRYLKFSKAKEFITSSTLELNHFQLITQADKPPSK